MDHAELVVGDQKMVADHTTWRTVQPLAIAVSSVEFVAVAACSALQPGHVWPEVAVENLQLQPST